MSNVHLNDLKQLFANISFNLFLIDSFNLIFFRIINLLIGIFFEYAHRVYEFTGFYLQEKRAVPSSGTAKDGATTDTTSGRVPFDREKEMAEGRPARQVSAGQMSVMIANSTAGLSSKFASAQTGPKFLWEF